jgi:hypothetical protein
MMRRLFVAFGLAAGLLALGACATLGEPVTLTMAELTQRCDDRGGTIRPTGAATGRAQADYVCQEPMARGGLPGRIQATTELGRATNDSLGRGN